MIIKNAYKDYYKVFMDILDKNVKKSLFFAQQGLQFLYLSDHLGIVQ